MKLIYACSSSYESLRDEIFIPSLRDPWELLEIRLGAPGKAEHPRALRAARWERIAEIVRGHPGEIMAVAHLDIRWLRPAQPLIAQIMEGPHVVFLRQEPAGGADLGFWLVRSSASSVLLMDWMGRSLRSRPNDGLIVNELIDRGQMPCSFSLLPATFFHDQLAGPEAPPPDWRVLYHAGDPSHTVAGREVRKLQRLRALGPSPSPPERTVSLAQPQMVAGHIPYVRAR